jgi:hypothetical protein
MTSVADRSISRAIAAYDKHYSLKKKKAIQIIKPQDVPNRRPQVVSNRTICRAINLNGKSCQCRAVQGGLCRRHSTS